MPGSRRITTIHYSDYVSNLPNRPSRLQQPGQPREVSRPMLAAADNATRRVRYKPAHLPNERRARDVRPPHRSFSLTPQSLLPALLELWKAQRVPCLARRVVDRVLGLLTFPLVSPTPVRQHQVVP